MVMFALLFFLLPIYSNFMIIIYTLWIKRLEMDSGRGTRTPEVPEEADTQINGCDKQLSENRGIADLFFVVSLAAFFGAKLLRPSAVFGFNLSG